jgi:hypothetical protein
MDRINYEHLEKMIMHGMFRYDEFRKKVFRTYKPEYFDDPNASHLFEFSKTYFDQYGQMPKAGEIISSTEEPDDINSAIK